MYADLLLYLWGREVVSDPRKPSSFICLGTSNVNEFTQAEFVFKGKCIHEIS